MNPEFFKDRLLRPVLALYSRAFYLRVLFALRGWGFAYLVSLAMVLALPITYRVTAVVDLLKSFELTSLVAQIPPSYMSEAGILSPKTDTVFAEIRNPDGELIIVYNPTDRMLGSEYDRVPVILTARDLLLRVEENGQLSSQSLPWTMIFEGSAGDFEPLQAASVFDRALNSPAIVFYLGAVIYLVMAVFINWVVIAAIGRLSMYYISRIRICFRDALRLSAYANTFLLILITVNFFVHLPFDITVLFLVPIAYILVLGRLMRSMVQQHGLEAFTAAINAALKRDALKTPLRPADFTVSGQEKAQPQGFEAQQGLSGMPEVNPADTVKAQRYRPETNVQDGKFMP
ncbi:MAG TPA: DUF1189 family protein [Candidatus Avisuccinivibrio pullicola]|nr:DUF1189 family protein [Candidatus Avisuccinivibrio pullicola]